MYQKYIKRTLDILLSPVLILILSPLFLLVAVIIKLDSKGPVFFTHKRAGKNLVPFTVYKFRTMNSNTPKNIPTNSFRDANSYITNPGRIMRKLSIDELPQSFNVLKGEMSIVGPRPVVLNETDLLSEREKYKANACRPGITGWAQVNGRDELVTSVKAKMDGDYVKSLGILMDLRCIFMTVFAVLSIKGNKDGHESVDSDLIQQQPKIVTNSQTAFYAKVSSQTGKTNKRSVVRRVSRTQPREKL